MEEDDEEKYLRFNNLLELKTHIEKIEILEVCNA